MRKQVWIASAALLVVALFVGIPGIRGAGRQDPDEGSRRAKGKAFEAGGLRAAARISGSYRQTMSAHGQRNVDSLPMLVENSRLIIIGQIRSNLGWLNEGGDTITTDYDVAIERTLKGHVKPGDRITMSVLGGRVRFPDGSWAQIDTPDMTPPFNNQTFILFLEMSDFHPSAQERARAHGPIYMPAFRSRGMYLLDGGIINPKTYPSHPLAKAYAGKAESVLVNDVLDIVEDPDGRRDKERSR